MLRRDWSPPAHRRRRREVRLRSLRPGRALAGALALADGCLAEAFDMPLGQLAADRAAT